jgi:hypothetical protein
MRFTSDVSEYALVLMSHLVPTSELLSGFSHISFGTDFTETHKIRWFNLQEPCVLYIGRAQHYPQKTQFYIFFQQIYVLNFLNMLHTLLFYLQNAVHFILLPFLGFLYY